MLATTSTKKTWLQIQKILATDLKMPGNKTSNERFVIRKPTLVRKNCPTITTTDEFWLVDAKSVSYAELGHKTNSCERLRFIGTV